MGLFCKDIRLIYLHRLHFVLVEAFLFSSWSNIGLFPRHVGLFCCNVGLFCKDMGLFYLHSLHDVVGKALRFARWSNVGLFPTDIGLFCWNVGLFSGHMRLCDFLEIWGFLLHVVVGKAFQFLSWSNIGFFPTQIGLFLENIKVFNLERLHVEAAFAFVFQPCQRLGGKRARVCVFVHVNACILIHESLEIFGYRYSNIPTHIWGKCVSVHVCVHANTCRLAYAGVGLNVERSRVFFFLIFESACWRKMRVCK